MAAGTASLVAALRDARKSALLRTRLIDQIDMIRNLGNDVLDDRFHETNQMQGGQRRLTRLTAFMGAVRAFAHAVRTRGLVGPVGKIAWRLASSHQPCQAILPTLR